LRGEQKTLARKKCGGTPLKVFSGKEATLNRVILLILFSGQFLAKYDLFLIVKSTKGFRNKDVKTIYRRVDFLEKGGWIAKEGEKLTKPGWPSELYKITLKGRAALKLDQKSIETFLENATDEQLAELIDLLS
jgi:DNA-binding PadR family transcriptional regulator